MKKEMLITIGISFFVEKRRYELMEQYKTVTLNIQGEFTKAQQEFLFDYYMERCKEKEANDVYQD